MSTQLDFQTSVSPKTTDSISSLNSSICVYNFLLEFSRGNFWFHFLKWCHVGPEEQQSAAFCKKNLDIQNHKYSAVLLDLNIGVSIDKIKPEKANSFLQFLELIRYIENGLQIDEMCQ